LIKCRIKTEVFEALQFDGNFSKVEDFCRGDAEFRDGELIVATREGVLHVGCNHFIIKDEKRHLTSITPEVFHKNYEVIRKEDNNE